LPGLDALTYSWPGTANVLSPGQTATATATYTVTEQDVLNGVVSNVAVANGTAPDDPEDPGEPIVDVPETPSTPEEPDNPGEPDPAGNPGDPTEIDTVDPNPSIILVKGVGLTSDLNNNNEADLGDVLTYTFSLINDGNVTLSHVEITDTDL